MGLAPIETPSRTMFSIPPITLKAYGDGNESGPILLIVPVPIKPEVWPEILQWMRARGEAR